ncbi:DNA cytosine methyltransferase [Lachnoclostridium sp.]|uniref:DNA cytosine methyltransferase n=1 Tax=Lachnoclostridium sp. TaxID=2028282 RepID=UPI0026A6DD1D|nr:DNA cytosine methyltransferase [Lachnoclostridium sp.]
MGGSPCTHWSIAQTKNRETEPSGLGWELFENYLIGLRKYKPDYFLYENNKSMAPAIREQITKELGVEPILINSALVSAQNRQRLYWTNIPGITQPEDKGILLRDIIETGVAFNEKAYTLDASYYKATDGTVYSERQSGKRMMVAESVQVLNINPSGHGMNGVVMHVNGKSRTLTTNKGEGPKIIEPIRIGTIENDAKNNDFDSQQYRVYSPEGKSVTICGNGGGVGAKTGLYAVPCMTVKEATKVGFTEIEPMGCVDLAMLSSKTRRGRNMKDKSNCLTTSPDFYQYMGTINRPIYEVRNGIITIKDKQYPIKMLDGYYIIRKLIVLECMRLQTVPEWYVFPVSNSQAYKMLGNGWTVDVIAHQLSFIHGINTEEIEVLSMYDGMSCGHIALDKLKANVVRYYATEIDKYAIQTTKHNYPNTMYLGDAYQVRNDDFILTSEYGNEYEQNSLPGQMTVDEWLTDSCNTHD